MMNIIHSLTGTGHKDENKDGAVHNDSARDPADHLTGSGTHPGVSDTHTGTGTGVGSTTGSAATHTGTHGTSTAGAGLPGVGDAPRASGEGTNLTGNYGHAQDGTYGGNVDNGRPAYRQDAGDTNAGVLPGRRTGEQPPGQGTDLSRNYGHAQDGTYGGNVDNARPVGGDNTASSNISGVPASGLPGQHAATGGHPTSTAGGAAAGILKHDNASSGHDLTGHSSAIGAAHSGTGANTGTTTTGRGLGSHSDKHHHDHHHSAGGTGTGIVGTSSATGPGSTGLRSGDENLGTRLTSNAGQYGTGVVSSSTADRTVGSDRIGEHHNQHHHTSGSGVSGTVLTGDHHHATHRDHTSGTALGGTTQGAAQAAGIAAGSAGGQSGSAFGNTTTPASSAERYKEGVVDSGRVGSHHQHGAGHHSATGEVASAASAAAGTGVAGTHGADAGHHHQQHHLSGLTHGHETAAPKGSDGLFDSNRGVPGGIRGEHKI